MSAAPLLQLLYVSSAVELLSAEQLAALLAQSQANNTRRGITGLLLYKGGNFMQVLEGEPSVVEALHGRILTDPRHHGVLTLMQSTITARDFPGWSMGFCDLGLHPPLDLPGFSEFLHQPLDAATFGPEPSRAKRLLLTFRSQMR